MDRKNDFIEKSKLIHGNIYDYSLVEYNGCKTKVRIICKTHGIFEQKPSYHLLRGCKRCIDDKKMMDSDTFIEKSKIIHNNIFDYSLVQYNGCKNKVKIICKQHGIFEQTPDNHLRKRGCPNCCDNKLLSRESIIDKLILKNGNLYDYSLVEYKGNKINIKIICNEHGIFEQTPNNHLRGTMCPTCSNISKFKNNKKFILDCINKHGNKYDYSLVEYNSSLEKVKIICKKHGTFKQRPNSHLNGQGCPICKESKGEISISKYLDKNKIKYIRQYKFDDCKYKNVLLFDFYIPSYNICIEFNGIQHYKKVDIWNKNSSLKETKHRDNIKLNYCIKNNISFLVIKYSDNIISSLDKFFKNK
jgi:hypothetical protein